MMYSDATSARNVAPSMLLAVVHPVPDNTTVVANQIPVHMNHAWPAQIRIHDNNTAPLSPNSKSNIHACNNQNNHDKAIASRNNKSADPWARAYRCPGNV